MVPLNGGRFYLQKQPESHYNLQSATRISAKVSFMRRFLLCLLLAFNATGQSVPNGNADITATWRTGSDWNGRFWKSLASDGEKNAFVMGYTNAVHDTLFGIAASLKADYSPVLKLLIPASLTVAETVTALNRFYDVPENGPIAVAGAMKVIAQRVSGADDATIQKATADLRSASTK